jgi:sugar/nucleoside kinase (ribokinase family)
MIITRGSSGATVVSQTNKKLTRYEVAGVSAGSQGHPTGCGDVFGAAFFYHYLHSKEAHPAAQWANTIAAYNASITTPELLDALPEELKMGSSFTTELAARERKP